MPPMHLGRPTRTAYARRATLLQAYREFDESPPAVIRPLKDGATQFVPGDGSFAPRLILIGEAPGAREDRTGVPFCGRSGTLLDELLQIADLQRQDVWITNVVKYRPPANRTPEPDEVTASLPLLRREVDLVDGRHRRTILGLGSTSCRALTGGSISGVGAAHGTWVDLRAGWRLFASYHPAAGLRNRAVQDAMREDFAWLGEQLREESK